MYVFILLLLLHVGLGGTLFNIRHRVDIIFPLIILFLTISKLIFNAYGYSYLKRQYKKSFILSLTTIIVLNIVYYIMKGVL